MFRSTQYLDDADISAMTQFLKSLPQAPPRVLGPGRMDPDARAHGAALYKEHCAACPGAGGEGGRGPDGVVYAP